ncbi:MAG TPA: MFS transporter, partial [Gammaproteobacteria bacterium]|nr:MFS transporter [Gammaproteobacteria bacterium]
IRAFTAFAAFNTIVALLHALYQSALTWGLLRIACGIAMMGMYMVIESWLNERADTHVRGRVFSVYMVMTFAGLGGGQFLLDAGKEQPLTPFLLVAILFAACLIPVALTRAANPQPVERINLQLRKLFHAAPFGVWGCLGAGLANGAFYALGPTFGVREGLNVTQVAGFMGATILGGLALQWPIGALSDRFDRQRVIGALSFAVAAISLILAVTGGTLVFVLLIVGPVFGGLTFTLYPVAVAHANDHIEIADVVPASAALILCYSLGAMLGPLGAAAVMWVTGATGLFLFTALLSLALGVAALLAPRVARVAPEDRVPYVPVPRTSAVIAQLDPRAPE